MTHPRIGTMAQRGVAKWKVFVVLCRVDQETEFDRIYATEHGARAYCQQQNTKPVYYGRYTFHQSEVRADDVPQTAPDRAPKEEET
jgi:hypothetical protein